ncbi:MAG: class IV adenylate cyclase [bacterium]|jgi:adenylate cyclase class 2
MREPSSEVEIKLRVRDASDARARLGAAGFRITRERTLESDTVYDNAERSLRRAGLLLRLRSAGGQALLTFKGPSIDGRHKTREEIETRVADGEAFAAILERLGYEASFRYEKYRTEYSREGEAGHVLLDETPIGVFLELEGPPEWIDQTARALGFAESDYITATYASLFFDWAREHPEAGGHMLFPR